MMIFKEKIKLSILMAYMNLHNSKISERVCNKMMN